MKEGAFGVALSSAQLAFKRFDARFEARRGRGQTLLEQALEPLEAVVAERLSKSDDIRRMHPAPLRNGADRQHRDVVWILGQVERYLLIRLAHFLVSFMDNANQLLVIGRRRRLQHH